MSTEKRINSELATECEALKAERDALADRVERLSGMLTESRVAAKSAEERADALALENAALKNQEPKAWYIRIGDGSVTTDPDEARMWLGVPLVRTDIETPATDAAAREIEAQGVEKFVTKISKQLREAGGERGYNLVDWCEYADHLEDRGEKFAAELREGK